MILSVMKKLRQNEGLMPALEVGNELTEQLYESQKRQRNITAFVQNNEVFIAEKLDHKTDLCPSIRPYKN